MEEEVVRILDTTLRDGAQSLAARLAVNDQVDFARQLEALGVDVIEAGFAATSTGEFSAVAAIAAAVTRPVVLSLARIVEIDVAHALKSVERAKRPGVHVFIQVPKHQRTTEPQRAIDEVATAVRYVRRHVDHAEFTVADATRFERLALVRLYGAAIAAGATVVNVPDTAGCALPDEFAALVRYLIAHTPRADEARWSVHCHNHLGMAVANSLAAARNGVRQIECTIDGIGPAGGNTSLTQVVAAITSRVDVFQPLRTNIVATEMAATRRLLHDIRDDQKANAVTPPAISTTVGVDAIGDAPWNQQ